MNLKKTTRRTFLLQTVVTGAAVALLPGPARAFITIDTIKGEVPMKKGNVKRALVLWYSQTGNTERMGRLIAKTVEKHGANVISSEMRAFDRKKMADMDLVIVGSPVFYYESPDYVKGWINGLPDLDGTPVAAFVTFGGPEGNQHNAACSILRHLSDRGGVPVGLKAFMNMSTFPLAWSEEKVHHKTWMSRHLPNEETYRDAREYAAFLVSQVEQGKSSVFSKKLTLREMSTIFGPEWWTKLFVKTHTIDKDACIQCGTCMEKCPSDAIDPDTFQINRKLCVLCFGCINNCPAQAVMMTYSGEKVFGYHEFMKRKKLSVIEPDELK